MIDYDTQPVENTGGGEGLLRVKVNAGAPGVPFKGAQVVVSDPDTGEELIRETTDAEGLIPESALPAPPFTNAQEYGGARPFNQYDLRVGNALIENVQIYARTTALQEVTLTADASGVVIPYPALWGDYPPKIPEAEIKALPFGDNYAVLPEPVVPEYIPVHAGVPSNASAPNYTVGFRDYVKNVASSEIYASWPRAAIEANVLAILSFTLNRVYTEWYRSRGYSFTITNSTAYDQSFTFGRNVYREISEAVDELFTTYISRSGVAQPLFAQYCDGVEVRRDGWLSQWGSKSLADRGFTALQILRSYYGGDVSLRQARRVEGVPLSFPGVLGRGSRGDGVRTVQRQLNAISRNYPAIGRLAVDGVYGPLTEAAVRQFQRIFGQDVTGRVNFPTWYEISRVYTAVERLA